MTATLVAWGNALLALVAAAVNGRAAFKMRASRLAVPFAFFASCALFYAMGFWWLGANLDRGKEWSEFFRWFGPIAWLGPWSFWAWRLPREVRRLERERDLVLLELADLAEAVK